MAFTVETGAGVSGANSYLSVADADTYHADRGNAGWAGDDALKQVALVKATDYIEQVYGSEWRGLKTDEDNALEWPRKCISGVDDDEIPQALKNAVAILALEALEAPDVDLNPSLDRGGLIKREKTDVLETEYMDGAPAETRRPAVEGLLGRYLGGSSINRRVVRV